MPALSIAASVSVPVAMPTSASAGCVIDAVACHSEKVALLLQSIHDALFIFGGHFGMHCIDPQLFGDCLGGACIIGPCPSQR